MSLVSEKVLLLISAGQASTPQCSPAVVPAEFSTAELKPSQSGSSIGTGQGGTAWLAFGQAGQLSPGSRTPSQSASSAHGADVGAGVRLGVGVWAEVRSGRSSPRTGRVRKATAILSQNSRCKGTRREEARDGPSRLRDASRGRAGSVNLICGVAGDRTDPPPPRPMLAYRLSGYKILRCRFLHVTGSAQGVNRVKERYGAGLRGASH